MTPNEVGGRIRRKRLEMNMTQKELAEKLNVTNKAVSQWERGICFPDICIIKSLTEVLPMTLTEIFIGEEEKAEEHCVENVLQKTLGYAEQNMDYKLKRYKKIGSIVGGIIFGLPIVVVFTMVILLFILVGNAPDAEATLTLAFWVLPLFDISVRFWVPMLLGYLLVLWRYSHFMQGKIAKYVKSWIFVVGIIIVFIWVYEFLRIALPKLMFS